MQRRQLQGLLKLLLLLGSILLLWPMIQSTGMLRTTAPVAEGIVVNIQDIQPGRYKVMEYAGLEFWVYHWSLQDKRQHNIHDDRLAWSVLVPYEPYRGCRVHLQEDMSIAKRFVEPCFNAGFDVNGKRLAGTGVAAQQNLPTIPFQWRSDSEIQLMPGTVTDK